MKEGDNICACTAKQSEHKFVVPVGPNETRFYSYNLGEVMCERTGCRCYERVETWPYVRKKK